MSPEPSSDLILTGHSSYKYFHPILPLLQMIKPLNITYTCSSVLFRVLFIFPTWSIFIFLPLTLPPLKKTYWPYSGPGLLSFVVFLEHFFLGFKKTIPLETVIMIYCEQVAENWKLSIPWAYYTVLFFFLRKSISISILKRPENESFFYSYVCATAFSLMYWDFQSLADHQAMTSNSLWKKVTREKLCFLFPSSTKLEMAERILLLNWAASVAAGALLQIIILEGLVIFTMEVPQIFKIITPQEKK